MRYRLVLSDRKDPPADQTPRRMPDKSKSQVRRNYLLREDIGYGSAKRSRNSLDDCDNLSIIDPHRNFCILFLVVKLATDKYEELY